MLDNEAPIRLVATGGTIDKEYDKLSGELTFGRDHIMELLDQARCTVPVAHTTAMRKDSLHLAGEDREELLRVVRETAEEHVIITHGTDTMAATARHLESAALPKTIVLVGAMIPFAFVHSDASFNMGCAVTAVRLLPHGVYVTMNGRVFTAAEAKKDTERGVFVSAPQED
jgi:L-asparaginase